MSNCPDRKHSAFTLIELLMVVSIVTIITGITIPSFTKYLEKQNIKNAKEQFINDLRTIQNKALTGEKFQEWIYYEDWDGWGWDEDWHRTYYWVVKWDQDYDFYKVYVLYYFLDYDGIDNFDLACQALPFDDTEGYDPYQNTYYLPEGVSFDTNYGYEDDGDLDIGCIFFDMWDGQSYYSNCDHDIDDPCLEDSWDMDEATIRLYNTKGEEAFIRWNHNGMIGN